MHGMLTGMAERDIIDDYGDEKWQNKLCGCFGDCKICILSFLLPCYIEAKNAEYFGESCTQVCLLSAIGCSFRPVLRWRTRVHVGVEGSMVKDLFYALFCPPCTLAQEAQELGWNAPDGGESIRASRATLQSPRSARDVGSAKSTREVTSARSTREVGSARSTREVGSAKSGRDVGSAKSSREAWNSERPESAKSGRSNRAMSERANSTVSIDRH